MFLYDANGNTVRHNSAADITPPRRCSFTSERPLAITEDLKIFTKDGEPHLPAYSGEADHDSDLMTIGIPA